ncbi:TrbI/VirB10 family protein [Luteibacter sp. 22Crub2.1]|uniref:TrbI/VirB10 family protein n=1 Tax=Luteibacter sp. 22Crub2.1 TaxID=1283288 RepID=UPI0009CD0F9E|nr:TrbI/VirB10 family protein [Luteibacter sp. 22Crub2.1]SKB56372.1 type IV secretion system protein VirB10 [Luteibacter sp. 22Crub2.1]
MPEPGDADGEASSPPAASGKPAGVRRVNNVPLLIIGGVMVVFVILVTLVAAQRGQKKEEDPPPAAGALPENSQLLEQMLAGGATGGLVPGADEQTVSFPVARVADPDAPPVPDRSAGNGVPDDTMAKERMKLFQSAMHARTGLTKPASPDVAPVKENEADKAREAEAQEARERDTRIPVHAEGDYSAFDGSSARAAGADRWLLDSGMEAPRTAFELRAGSVIPATMISGINSELPGQIIAQVSQDVFDTPTGRHRLVPQGSRLVGRYNHKVIEGQSRVLVAWQRIVFPDGKALDIGAMEGVDSAGYAGFSDKVDRHYARMFASAILMSGIATGLTSSSIRPGDDPFGSSSAVMMRESLARQVGEVASKMIDKNMSYAPELKIRPGYRFNVMAVKDLTFRQAYKPFDY